MRFTVLTLLVYLTFTLSVSAQDYVYGDPATKKYFSIRCTAVVTAIGPDRMVGFMSPIAAEKAGYGRGEGCDEQTEPVPSVELIAMVQASKDPFNDPTVIAAARKSIGADYEGIFGPEIYAVENSDCSGRVVGVTDGDTVKILNSQNRQVTVRLSGIDAPEKSQAYGYAAKQYLSDMIYGQNVSCRSNKKDRYGRTVGQLFLGGRDINLAMVSGCHAWHYKEYQGEQSAADRSSYAKAEDGARSRGCGLWSSNPIKPSDFRKQQFLSIYRDQTTTTSSEAYGSSPILSIPSTMTSTGGGGPVQVKGYYRKDGTYVRPHTRSAPRRN
jgi:endonuclease YncB( thermonuclease family)